jgi:hypothetical protein
MSTDSNGDRQRVSAQGNTTSIPSLSLGRGATQKATPEEERYVWDDSVGAFARCRGEPRKFLKGPIPWKWIARAAELPGAALAVGLCIWRLVGATRRSSVKLSNKECELLGVSRYAKSRALRSLELAGLVSVEHRRGRFPRVEIVAIQ